MPPADQFQRLDPGQRPDKDPLNPASDFLAAGPSLQILQLNVEGLSAAKRTISYNFYSLDNNNVCTMLRILRHYYCMLRRKRR